MKKIEDAYEPIWFKRAKEAGEFKPAEIFTAPEDIERVLEEEGIDMGAILGEILGEKK